MKESSKYSPYALLLDIQHWIFLHALHPDLEVNVNAGGPIHEPRIAHRRDELPALHLIPHLREELFVVRVEGDEIIAMVSLDHVAFPAVPPVLRPDHGPGLGGIHRPAALLLQVEGVVAGVEGLRDEAI